MSVYFGKEYPKALLDCINNSKHSVDVVMYDWRVYPGQPGRLISKLNQAILKATRRGVRVCALINDSSQKSSLESLGCSVKVCPTKKTLHAKIVIIDKNIFFVGSHNFSMNAFDVNHEITLQVFDDSDQLKILNYFRQLWAM